MQRCKRKLIETVAEDIAAALLRRHSMLCAVRVGISKPHVSIDGHFTGMGIEIFRRRSDRCNSAGEEKP